VSDYAIVTALVIGTCADYQLALSRPPTTLAQIGLALFLGEQCWAKPTALPSIDVLCSITLSVSRPSGPVSDRAYCMLCVSLTPLWQLVS
jgi:hypothetical protein